MIVLAAIAQSWLGAGACPAGEGPCYGDTQCAEGQVCSPRGRCVAATDAGMVVDAGADAGNASDAAAADRTGSDASSPDQGAGTDASSADAGVDDAGQPLCPPFDGTLHASQLRLGPNLTGRYRVIDPDQPAEVNLVPEQTAAGPRWDFAAAVAGEQSVELNTLDPAGSWYAEAFPDASYAAALEYGADVLGVFRISAERVELLGVVSIAPDETELHYDPPVVVFALPFAVGDRWSTESTVTGTYDGLMAGFYEDYSFEVVARGTAVVPAGSFEVLQVRMERINQIPTLNPFYFITTTTLKYQFIAPCYGAVASVGSQDDEPEDPFGVAREYTRLGF